MQHYHHSPLIKFISLLAWFLTALGAINWGLEAAGYNLFETHFVMSNMAHLIPTFQYIIGISGLISLLMLFDVIARHSRGESCKC